MRDKIQDLKSAFKKTQKALLRQKILYDDADTRKHFKTIIEIESEMGDYLLCEPSETIFEQALIQIKEALEALRRPLAKDTETEEEKEIDLPQAAVYKIQDNVKRKLIRTRSKEPQVN